MVDMEWYNELKRLSKGMPPLDAVPDMDIPESPPPTAAESIVKMDDQRLSDAYHLVSKWKAYCDYAAGVYAAAEVAYAQRVGELKNQVYMEKFSETKPKNAKEGEIMVDSDPRVKSETSMWNTMRQGRIMYDKRASTYQQLAMTYGNERKDRRLREGFGE